MFKSFFTTKLILSFLLTLSFLLPLNFSLLTFNFASAAEIDELTKQIEDRKKIIQALDKEIQENQVKIQQTQGEAKTLQGTIKTLDTSKKKIETDIKKTETQISTTELTMKKISFEILTKEEQVKENNKAIGETLRKLRQADQSSFIENLLGYNDMSEFWNDVENVLRLQNGLRQEVSELRRHQNELQGKHEENEEKKEELVGFTKELSGKKQSVEYAKKEKADLLAVTKSKEQTYQQILAQKQAQKAAFEKELFDYEQKLKTAVDPDSVPGRKPGLLGWPLASVFITQNFGQTSSSGRLYASGTHNGVDFRASIGTSVKSAGDGVVAGSGNTDGGGCYSYGKWILINHANGLSTLYAHLSVISVTTGTQVTAGQVIGQSGNTGYSTGPHLHFTVFASTGVAISQYVSSNFCKQTSIPLPTKKNAYLDPMVYLPTL